MYTTPNTAKNLLGKTTPVSTSKKPFFAPVDVSEEVRALAGNRVGVMVAPSIYASEFKSSSYTTAELIRCRSGRTSSVSKGSV